ncbi:cation:proton antiporter [Candidatus Woesearchaeota archaeon]|nr:cation:proton antiporter [Candidatus Woesearchaeota archaeon]
MEPFFLIGIIILIGFLGYFLYSKTQIPEILILIIVGIILGPVTSVVPRELLMAAAPIFSTLALIILIVDAGLSLDILRVVREFFSSLLFTVSTVVLTVLFVGSFFTLVGWQWQHALLLGIVSAGTTTVTVMSLVQRLHVNRDIKDILMMESIINDILLIVGATTMLQFIKYETLSFYGPLTAMLANFSVGVVLGAIVGVAWLRVLSTALAPHLSYISTLGIVFVLFDISEWVGGSGAVAALIFSLILGNAKRMKNRLHLKGRFGFARELRLVHFNISFFVRTFFFVMLGITFNPSILDWNIFFHSLGLLALLVAARWVSAWGLAQLSPSFAPHRFLLTMMMPRGLVATVLAFLPLKEGIVIPHFIELVLIMIFSSTIAANLGIIIYQRYAKKQ